MADGIGPYHLRDNLLSKFPTFHAGDCMYRLHAISCGPGNSYVIVSGGNMETWKVGGHTVGVVDSALRASSNAFDPGVHCQGCRET